MEDRNNVTEFILLGLSTDKKVRILCFLFFLFCYLAIWLGNLIIVISISCSQPITQPVYSFLNCLAPSDLFYTSTMSPKLMTDLLLEKKVISYKNCVTQLFTTQFFGGIEVFILTGMAYDHYVAICKPLHYAIIMNRQRHHSILIASGAGGLLHSLGLFLLAIVLPFCGPNEIDHYFCDAYPLLKLACTDTHKIGFFVIANSGLMGLGIFVVFMASYILILYNVHTYSAESRHKALFTCSSITVVILFFIPVIFVYIRPATTLPEDKVFTLFYTIIVPMLNPLIYTLRNMEMKNSIRRVWCNKRFWEGRLMI
ncbi:olfactory receptor 4P4-like [Dama dama]|uniref:olfactory receptor 4P4-like n=1 Tax=Dama dama TaxID=30532 RepID=UPI002A35E1FD|nr:olfactory receptor 4P4-like [Dama dama]